VTHVLAAVVRRAETCALVVGLRAASHYGRCRLKLSDSGRRQPDGGNENCGTEVSP
jgi:hypothetical protein